MVIVNKDVRVYGIAGGLGPGGGPAITLLPGVNNVDEEIWAKPEVCGSARHLIKAGLIEVRETVSVETLAKFKTPEAIGLVKETIDRELLESWQETEKRGDVRSAIAAQLKAITPEKPEQKPKE